jgi:3D (Asp-Asp-Asp) domain-containing protein
MAFTLVQSTRRRLFALVVAVIIAAAAYETRMLDSGYTAWLEMISSEDEAPAPGAHLVFDATAYCKGTTTAAGVNVRRGIAAADPKLLPVGSVVTLATGDPEYNGVYTIMDTGPKVQGRHLDLYIWNCNEALTFGRRRIEVTVLRLGWDPRASSPSLIDRLFRRREIARRTAESKAEKEAEAPQSAAPEEGATASPEIPAGDPAPAPDAAVEPASPAPPEAKPAEPPVQPAPASPLPPH